MKAVFLCAGEGTRLRPITYALPKPLVPVGGKPTLVRGIETMRSAGIEEIVVVANPCNVKIFEEKLGDGAEFGVRIDYAIQEKPLGLAHALKSARDIVKDEEFVLYLGDNVIEEDMKSLIEDYKGNDALILLDEVEDPRRFGVAVVENGYVKRVVEKPKEPPSNLAIVGLYIFKPVVFEVIEKLKPSWRGEYEITDAIGMLIEKEFKVKGKIMKGWWKDVGTFKDLLETNALLLKGFGVSFGKDSEIKGVRFEDPVLGGEGVVLKDSNIGPNVYIGRNVVIEESRVVNSIILDSTVVKYSRITDSIIGSNSKVEHVESHRLIIPNDSVITKVSKGF